jgi:hypothetical protein
MQRHVLEWNSRPPEGTPGPERVLFVPFPLGTRLQYSCNLDDEVLHPATSEAGSSSKLCIRVWKGIQLGAAP